MNKDRTFSDDNFDLAYKYLEGQIKSSNKPYYHYNEYEIHLIDEATIAFKKKAFTLSKVIKAKGIFSLSKNIMNNNKTRKETTQIFCEIISKLKTN